MRCYLMANMVRKSFVQRSSPGIRPLLLLLIMVLFASATVFALSLREAIAMAWLIETPLKACLLLSGALALLSAGIMRREYVARCPSCKLWWGRVELSREVINRRLSQRIVNLRTVHKGNLGVREGYSDREELRLVTIERHRCHNKCKHCPRTWTDYETVQL
jgi:hypothetical protein